MQSNNGENDLSVFVANLNEEAALASVEERLSKGDDPFAILDDCQKGLQWVGERYEQGTYYISGLIMAGEIMRLVGEKVLPLLEKNIKGGDSGLIILGTVQGDIHFLGKDIVKVLLKCYGFTVSDLGVDVPPDEFLASTRESRPDIVGLSCLLNTSFEAMRETIQKSVESIGQGQRPWDEMKTSRHYNDLRLRMKKMSDLDQK
jgi:methanogenic corrinoid protein MtbC1